MPGLLALACLWCCLLRVKCRRRLSVDRSLPWLRGWNERRRCCRGRRGRHASARIRLVWIVIPLLLLRLRYGILLGPIEALWWVGGWLERRGVNRPFGDMGERSRRRRLRLVRVLTRVALLGQTVRNLNRDLLVEGLLERLLVRFDIGNRNSLLRPRLMHGKGLTVVREVRLLW